VLAKTSAFIGVSLDGFIARKNGDLDWLPYNGREGEDYGFRQFFGTVDALVMGRKTFENVLTSGEWFYGTKKVIVLSTGKPEIPPELSDRVSLMNASPREVVETLTAQGARHLYIDGGNTVQRFLRAGLIGELTITTVPVLIGEGIPLFGPLEHDIRLVHLETRQFADGLVQSRYRVSG
jgi:dihydrofolate reductase